MEAGLGNVGGIWARPDREKRRGKTGHAFLGSASKPVVPGVRRGRVDRGKERKRNHVTRPVPLREKKKKEERKGGAWASLGRKCWAWVASWEGDEGSV